jgi:membrane-associated protein
MFLGYFFGTIPAVQENFAATIVAIILLSCLPVVFEIIQAKKEAAAEKAAAGGGSGSAPA